MKKGGTGMGGFMGAMNAMSGLSEAYNDPPSKAPVKKATTIKKTTTTVNKKPIQQQQQQQQKKPQQQQNKPMQSAQQNVTNTKNQSKQSEQNNNNNLQILQFTPKKQIISQQQESIQSIQNKLQGLNEGFQITEDNKNYYSLLANHLFNNDFDLPIYDFSEKQQEKQSIEELLNNCSITKEKFTDLEFQPQQNYQRLTEAVPNAQLFQNISAESVIQGSLGDCYLLSSIGVLSEKPFYITRLFKNKQINEQGAYQILINESGVWKKLFLDDFFPCNQYGPIYCKPKNGDVYAMFLEKAYAKIYGGYKAIEVGFSQDSLKDLTGAISDYIDIKKNPQGSWQEMKSSLQSQYVLTASSKADSEQMVSKHCYGILQLKEFKKDNKSYQFVQIRNPYGTIGGQSLIEKLPESVLQLLQEPVKQAGGIMYMLYDDFIHNFEVVTVSKLHPGYSYSFLNFPNKNKENYQILEAEIQQKEGDIYFSLHEKHARFQCNNNNDLSYKHIYNTKRIIIFTINPQTNQIKDVIGGDFNCKQSCYFFQKNLKPGKYYIYAEIDRKQQQNHELTISTYSEHPVSLQGQNQAQQFDFSPIMTSLKTQQSFVQELILGYLTSQEGQKLQSQVKDYQNPQDANGQVVRKYGSLFGYVYIAYFNQYKNSVFYETIEEFPILDNLYSQELLKNIQFTVQPSQNQVFLLKIGNKNNCSHKLTFKSKSNFSSSSSSDNINNNNNSKEDQIQQTIKNGSKKQRQGMKGNINVFVYTMKTNEGFFIVYENQQSTVYKESLTFKTLQNLVIKPENPKNLKIKTVNINLQPGQKYWIQLSLQNPADANSKYSCSFQMMM